MRQVWALIPVSKRIPSKTIRRPQPCGNRLNNRLQNPNAGDRTTFQDPNATGEMEGSFFEEMLPKPQHMLLGAPIGVAIAAGLEWLCGEKRLLKIAETVDNIPLLSFVSRQIDEHIINKMANAQNEHMRLLMNSLDETAAERLIVQDTTGLLKGIGASDDLIKDALEQKTVEGAKDALKAVREGVLKDEASILQHHFGSLGRGYTDDVAAQLANAKTLKEAEKIIQNNGIVRKLWNWVTRKPNINLNEAQRGALKDVLKQARQNKVLLSRVINVEKRLESLAEQVVKPYGSQKMLTQTLKKEGVGPVGRGIAGFFSNLRSIFTGSTLRVGKELAEDASERTLMNKIQWGLGPALMGAVTVGQSFTAASKAEKGDKVSTFFHDFLGFGLGNFLGWEIGKRVLNKVAGAGLKALEKVGMQRVKRVLTHEVVKLFGFRITLLGFAIEMIAMFGFGGVFQAIGEKISDTIFGRPKSIEGDEFKTREQLAETGLNHSSRYSAMETGLHQRPSANTNDNAQQAPERGKRARRGDKKRHHQTEKPPGRQEVLSQFNLTPEQIADSPAARYADAQDQAMMKYYNG